MATQSSNNYKPAIKPYGSPAIHNQAYTDIPPKDQSTHSTSNLLQLVYSTRIIPGSCLDQTYTDEGIL